MCVPCQENSEMRDSLIQMQSSLKQNQSRAGEHLDGSVELAAMETKAGLAEVALKRRTSQRGLHGHL